MRVLIAEDDAVSRHLLQAYLTNWGYEVIEAHDGNQAWQKLQNGDAPQLVILDWLMPGMDGLEVCRKLRQQPQSLPIYVIMLTIKDSKDDIVSGFKAGADDYITKPFDRDELQARIQAGIRTVQYQSNLAQRVNEMEQFLASVKRLRGVLAMCSYCKRIRTDDDEWEDIDYYLTKLLGTHFSHTFCPECYQDFVKPQLDEMDG